MRRHALESASFIAIFLAGLNSAMAQPVGGQVVAGQARIGGTSTATVITQSSAKAIINWQDFSVAAGSSVRFDQPNSSAVTLNRVLGTGQSVINGSVSANGQVWLLNPNGMLFGQGSQVHVGGLLATTSDLANNDFLSGNYSFNSGGSGAIVNKGTITAAKGGSVVLSAPQVSNQGLIQAQAGHVVLGGADAFAVDFDGDHLLRYAVTAPVSKQAGDGSSAKVSNSGVIRAEGGTVLLTARAAANVQAGVVNNSGVVEATSARVENGEIILDAGDGDATNSGTLDASGKASGQTGGAVQVLGKTVAIADGAKIDVSGDAGGGTTLIGGNFHGAGPQANAQTTTVGHATITADAITRGNGGKVAVWSDSHTQFAGSISAKGGAKGGDGGQVETSGATLNVVDDADVSTAAAVGTSGSWLLDPGYIYIQTGGTDPATGQTFAANASAGMTIAPSLIDRALISGNVTLQANTDIEVDSALTITGTAPNTLSLQAGRSIILNSSISYAGGTVALSANDPGAIATWRNPGTAGISGTGAISAANIDLVLHADGSNGEAIGNVDTPLTVLSGNTYIATDGANAFISTVAPGIPTGSLALGNSGHTLGVDMGAGSLTITANGVTQSAALSLNNLTITTPSGISTGNPVLLNNKGNAITGTVNIQALGVDPNGVSLVTLYNAQALTLGNVAALPDASTNYSTYGSVDIRTTSGDLTLTGTVEGGPITLYGAANLVETANGLFISHQNQSGFAGTVALDSGADINMPNANIMESAITYTGNGSETVLSGDGELAFAAGGKVTLNIDSNIGLYAATAGGDMSVTASGTYALSDAAGNITTTGNAIDIYNPVTTSGFVTLHAAGDIQQMVSPNTDVHIATPEGVIATSDSGSIYLTDGGHAANSGPLCGQIPCPADPGNEIGGDINGYSVFNSAGNTSFTNTMDTILGGPAYYPIDTNTGLPVTPTFPHTGTPTAPPANYTSPDSIIGGRLDVEISDANEASGHSVLVLAGRIHAQNSNGGYSTLHAAGDLINNNGAGTIYAGTGAYNNLNLASDYGAVGGFDGTAWTFGDGTDGAVLNLRAVAATNILINPGAINIGVTGLVGGFQAPSVTVFGNGTVTQNADASGTIITGSLDIHALGDVTLNNAANAISGAINFRSTGNNIALTNSVTTYLNQASGAGGVAIGTDPSNLAQNVTITVHDPSGATTPGLVLGNSPNTDATGAGYLLSIDASGTVMLAVDGGVSDGYIASAPTTAANAGHIVADTLSIRAGAGAISLLNPANAANNFDAVTSDQDIAFATAQSSVLNIDAGGLLAGNGNIILSAPNAAIADSDAITANNLDVAGASIAFTGLTVNSVSARTTGGDIELTSSAPLFVSNAYDGIGIDSQGGQVVLGAPSLSQDTSSAGRILAGNLTAGASAGDLMLTNSGNAITGAAVLAAQGGNVDLVNSTATQLATSVASGAFTVESGGDITILPDDTVISQQASGDAVVLSTGGNFINNSGASALQLTGSGRFLIYSQTPSGDVFGGLNSGNMAVWNTGYPTTITASGSRYVFTYQPTITVTAGNLTKTYGTDNSAAVAADYSITGVEPGVTGAFKGDTNAVYSGAPILSSPGSPASAGAGNYAIGINPVNMLTTDGYALQTVSGELTVNPATLVLTYNADAVSRAYGAANPLFTGTVTGFVNGDTQASATTGTLAFTTTATQASPVGQYAITGSGLSANNYVFTQAASNATALTINPATLTYTATAAGRIYGAANPALSGTVSGFVNGDTQGTATTGTLGFATTASQTSGVGAYAITGSGLSASNYVFTQAASNATALTINPASLTYVATAASRIYGAANPALSGTVSGFVNGDTQGTATTGTLGFATTASQTSGVGAYAITGSGLSASNYVFTQAGGNATALTINPATLTYVATAASRIYGAANPTLTGTVSGFVNGDTQGTATTGALGFATTASQTSGVGSYAITGSGLSASNYVFTQASGNATALTIDPAALTLALTGTVSKTFDGTTAASLSAGNYGALTGVIGTDDVRLAATPTGGTYDTPNVGTGKTVTVTGLSLAGGKAQDYTLASVASGAIGVITQPVPTGPQAPQPNDPVLISYIVASQAGGGGGPGQPGYYNLMSAPSLQTPSGEATPQPQAADNQPAQPRIPGAVEQLAGIETSVQATASYQAIDYIVRSLDHGGATMGNAANNGEDIIPGLLKSAPVRGNGENGSTGELSAWGNSALWQ